MSVDFTFNKKISFDDIEQKTSLKIIENNGKKWIIDTFNNHMLIKENNYVDKDRNPADSPTLELTAYGGSNSTNIRDELIRHFNTKFITDNEEDMFYYKPELLDKIDEIYNSVMEDFGYIIKDDIIIIPHRSDSDYKQHKNNEPIIQSTTTDFNGIRPKSLNNVDSDDLPF